MNYTPTQSITPPTARPAVVAPGAVSDTPAAPLSVENLRELELAQGRAKKIRRAIGVALFNGWTTGIFAAISLLCGLFSLTSFLIGIALAIVSYNEFAGAKMFRRFDEQATRRLGFNQLGFCGVLIIYSLWSIYCILTEPNPYAAALPANDRALATLGSIEQMYTTISLTVYGSLIFLSMIFQGGTAWYYFTRGKYIRAYVNETPPWIIDLQRSTSTL